MPSGTAVSNLCGIAEALRDCWRRCKAEAGCQGAKRQFRRVIKLGGKALAKGHRTRRVSRCQKGFSEGHKRRYGRCCETLGTFEGAKRQFAGHKNKVWPRHTVPSGTALRQSPVMA